MKRTVFVVDQETEIWIEYTVGLLFEDRRKFTLLFIERNPVSALRAAWPPTFMLPSRLGITAVGWAGPTTGHVRER